MTAEHPWPQLSAPALRHGLVAPWRRLDVLDETGSTNADLLTRSAAGEDIDGAVLAAEYQNAGRGRHGRSWSAPPRSQIAVSVGIGADGAPSEAWGWLPLLTGVAVVDAVRELTGIDAGLKWPNDVLVDSGKLAGILAEVAAPKPVIVVGIGLNVSFTRDEAPDPAATSLLMLGAADVDRNVLLANLLGALAQRVRDWRSTRGPSARLRADYEHHSLTLGSEVRATLPGHREVVGVARAVDDLGRLTIDTGDGVVTVSAGDITHLRAGD